MDFSSRFRGYANLLRMLIQKGNDIFCSAANEGVAFAAGLFILWDRSGSLAFRARPRFLMGHVVQLTKRISFEINDTAAPRAAATLLITLVLISAPRGAVPGSG
jgi:hypothetical protein